jgi:glycine hydroxymethyltransferase
MIIAGASAYSRIIDFARFRAIADSKSAPLLVDMAHFSGLVAAGIYPNPCEWADIVTSTTHKTLRGPRSGIILCREQFAQADRQERLPRRPGRSPRPCHGRQGRLLPRGHDPRVHRIPEARRCQRPGLAATLTEAGYRIVSGGTDTHLLLLDVFSKGLRGKEAERALDAAWITANKNAIPFDVNPPLNPSGIRLGQPAVTTRGFGPEEMREVGRLIGRVLENPVRR